jgi:hypothetical protein
MGEPQDYCTGGECPDLDSFPQEDDAATIVRRQRADKIRGRILAAVVFLALAGAVYFVACFNVRASMRQRAQVYPEAIVLLNKMIGPIADDIRDLSMNPNTCYEELQVVRMQALMCSETLAALVVLNNTLLVRSSAVSAKDCVGIFECAILSRIIEENLKAVAESQDAVRSDLRRMKFDAEKGKKYSI